MAIFTDGELDDIRATFDGLLPGTCNILSATRTKTATGGGTITWGTATAGVACDVWRVMRQPQEIGLGRFGEGAELVAMAEYTFAMPHDTTISESHRIEFRGGVYQVVKVDDALPDQLQLRVHTRRTESDE